MNLDADSPVVQKAEKYLKTSFRDDTEAPNFTQWSIELVEIVLSHLASQSEDAGLTEKDWLDYRGSAPAHGDISDRQIFNAGGKAALLKATPIIRAKAEKDAEERVEQSKVEQANRIRSMESLPQREWTGEERKYGG